MDRHLIKLAFMGAALLSLGLGTAPVVTDIARASYSKVLQAPHSAPLLAQIDKCRRVNASVSELNVRQAPSLAADVVGIVPSGEEVVLQDLGEGDWALITAPYDGYVSSQSLGACN